jgi:hypothetical protein
LAIIKPKLKAIAISKNNIIEKYSVKKLKIMIIFYSLLI